MRLLVPALLAGLVLAGAWCLAPAGAEAPSMSAIEAGDTPGGFALNDQDGKAVRLGHGKDHGWFVLAFYPKASTGG